MAMGFDVVGATHDYHSTDWIVRVDTPNVSAALVYQGLLAYPAPGASGIPVTTGTVSYLLGGAPVVHLVSPNYQTVTNVTLPDHVLSGLVIRQVDVKDGWYVIENRGIGWSSSGWSQAGGPGLGWVVEGFNQLSGPAFIGSTEGWIRNFVLDEAGAEALEFHYAKEMNLIEIDGSYHQVVGGALVPIGLLPDIFDPPHCFPAGTEISTPNGDWRKIEALSIGDSVSSYNSEIGLGRSAVRARSISRTFSNITNTWIKLSTGLTVTPGHHVLDAFGKFRTIEEILRTDSKIVLADGTIAQITGEYIHYSESTAHLYEQAEGYVSATVGNLALAPVYKKGWKTYNFEVEDYHTYIAGGVRVHNDSVFTASGSDLDIGSNYTNASGDQITVNPDGSIYNHNTGYTTPSAGVLAYGNFHSAEAIGVSGQQQTDLANLGAFDKWQIAGSGPDVQLASGEVVPAGTQFASGSGYTTVVNRDGTVTNLKTGYTSKPTYGELLSDPFNHPYDQDDVEYQYNPFTGNFDYYYRPGSGDDDDDGDSGDSGEKPILLDLDGDGIDIAQLGTSNLFFDIVW